MDIRQLRYFLAVADNLSFTAAAKSLFITQPSLSQQIAELERVIGVQLFIRDRHSVRLTPAGIALLPQAREMILKSEEAIRIAHEAKSGKTGRLTIGFPAMYETSFLPQLLKTFRASYPNIELIVKLMSLGELDKFIYSNNIDIGFTPIEQPAPDFYWKTIKNDTLCAVVNKDHPLADRTCICFSQVARDPIIFQEPSLSPRGFRNLLRICSTRRFSPNFNGSPNLGSVLLSLEAGLGVSILPRQIPQAYASSHLALLDIDGEDLSVDMSVAWSKSSANPCIPLFIEELERSNPLFDTASPSLYMPC